MRLWTALLVLATLIPAASALGLAQDYLPNGTIIAEQGQNVTHNLELQNTRGQDLRVNLTVRGEYATINGQKTQDFLLEADDIRTKVPILLAIPQNATPATHVIQVSVEQLPTESGTVGVGVRMSDNFKLEIQEAPGFFERARTETAQAVQKAPWLVIIGIPLAIIILLLVYKRSSLLAAQLTGNTKRVVKHLLKDISEAEFQEFKKNGLLREYVNRETQDAVLAGKIQGAHSKKHALKVLREH